MNEISASDLGYFIQTGCNLDYVKTTCNFKPDIRGQIFEKNIREIILSQNQIAHVIHSDVSFVDITQYIDKVLARFYRSLKNYSEHDRKDLKRYLLYTVSNFNSQSIEFLKNQFFFKNQLHSRLRFEHTLIENITEYKVIALIDLWQQIGRQVIIGEIRDWMWIYPFPNSGNLVQTVIVSLIASKKSPIVEYNWILYVSVSKHHYFCLYPHAYSLITDTILRYNDNLHPNNCDWCKILYQKSPLKLMVGGNFDE